MSRTIAAIVKVGCVDNKKLVFFSANNLNVPYKVVYTHNIRSIDVIKDTTIKSYITHFHYHNDSKSVILHWLYALDEYSWEKETVELINRTIEMV
jgi:hypothetical protein